MKIIIEAEPEEIAALVLELQERPVEEVDDVEADIARKVTEGINRRTVPAPIFR